MASEMFQNQTPDPTPASPEITKALEITRALVLEHLYGAEDLPFPESPREIVAQHCILKEDDALDGIGVISWLITLADQEQQKMDWTSEYSGQGTDTKPSWPGMNTEVLEKISLGEGPRPSKEVEDLLAPYRKVPAESADETYEEISAMLLAWNKEFIDKRYSPGDQSKQRNELYWALEYRLPLLLFSDTSPQDELDGANERLLNALHAFRPETAGFQYQDAYVILAVLVANIGVAEPDIRLDLALYDMLMMNMLAEARTRYPIEVGRTKQQISDELKAAKSNGEEKKAERLKKEYHTEVNDPWKAMFERWGKQVLIGLKGARSHLRQKELEQMQDLTLAQACQKDFCKSKLADMDILHNLCDRGQAKLERALRDLDGSILVQEVLDTNQGMAREISKDIVRRERKFRAEDIADPGERARVFKERLENPETAKMMLGVKEDTDQLRDTNQALMEKADLESAMMGGVYEAAKERLAGESELYERYSSQMDCEAGDGWEEDDEQLSDHFSDYP